MAKGPDSELRRQVHTLGQQAIELVTRWKRNPTDEERIATW